MSDKIGDKKIGSVQSTNEASRVKSADLVENVDKVKAAQNIKGVGSVGGVSGRRATAVMSAAEREKLFAMINEEADRLFQNMPEEKKKLVSEAVKMAVDASIPEEEPS